MTIRAGLTGKGAESIGGRRQGKGGLWGTLALALTVLLGLATPASAGPITAPLEGYITLAELRHLVETVGPLVWTVDGDMVIAQSWDEEPGHGATIKHPGFALDLFETAATTTAVLANVARLGDCGRWQLDFEQYPLDHSTLKSLVIDSGVVCGHESDGPPESGQTSQLGQTPEPIPEPATLGLVGIGLLAAARRLKRR